MTNNGRAFLIRLEALAGLPGKGKIYPCIQDLVENGLDLGRFAPGEIRPNRQDITQYLAAWCRHAQLSEEETRGWLPGYCCGMLAAISKSSAAGIRHSTGSNLRYIYGSAVPFVCERAGNRFRARCSSECPVYDSMEATLRALAAERAKPKPAVLPAAIVPQRKQVYKEQFQIAMALALEQVQKGVRQRRIVEILNERGLKTRTGRVWTDGILRDEFNKLKSADVQPQDAPPAGAIPEGFDAAEGDAPRAQ